MGRNEREKQEALVLCVGDRYEFKLESQLEAEVMEDDLAFSNLHRLTLLRKAMGDGVGLIPGALNFFEENVDVCLDLGLWGTQVSSRRQRRTSGILEEVTC